MMISPIEKLDFIFGKARDEFEMKILISSPIVKTTLFSLLLTRNINWKLISPKGGWVLGQEQGKEKNLTFDKVGCLTVTVGFVFLFNTHTCFQLPILAADIIITLLFGPDNFTRKRTTRAALQIVVHWPPRKTGGSKIFLTQNVYPLCFGPLDLH